MQTILIIALVVLLVAVAVLAVFLSRKNSQLKIQEKSTKDWEQKATDFSANLAAKEVELADAKKKLDSIHIVSGKFSADTPDSKAISALLMRSQGTVKKSESFKSRTFQSLSGDQKKEITIAFIKPE